MTPDEYKKLNECIFEVVDEYKNCVVCGKAMNMTKKQFKTLMHNSMHRYVCSSKCMVDFYK